MQSDIRDFDPAHGKSYADHIMMNPPFYNDDDFMSSPYNLKSMARDFKDSTLDDWLKSSHRLLKSNGSLTIIFPTFGLDQILSYLHKKFGAIEVIPLLPKAGQSAKRVIIRAIKDRKTPLKLHAGIIIHDDGGAYTKEADMILRNGCSIA